MYDGIKGYRFLKSTRGLTLLFTAARMNEMKSEENYDTH